MVKIGRARLGYSLLPVTFGNKISGQFKHLRPAREGAKGILGFSDRAVQFPACRFDANKRDQCRFARGRILGDGFANNRGIAFHVKKVIGNLKRQP